MLPQRHASVRYKSRPGTLIPFRDDSSLVGLRYDQTTQAEPPIPIPPRSPLRALSRHASTRPVSYISSSTTAPVVIAPPRPAPPAEQHPALRTVLQSTAPRTKPDDPKRDSGLAPTASSRSGTFYEESEDEDPFQYEKFPITRRLVIPEFVVPPLRIRPSSPTSIYSENGQGGSLGGTNDNSSQSSIPLPSPGLSEVNTVSPTSPTTPPPSFPDKLPEKTFSSSIFSRPFSLRAASSSMRSSTRRLKKRYQPPAMVEDPRDGTPAESPNRAKTPPAIASKANYPPLAEPNGAPLHHHDFSAPSPVEESPALTTAPAPGAADDFSEFVESISFSKRGSIMLGGKRPSKEATAMGEHEQERREPRAFPLAPSPMPRSQAHGVAPSIAPSIIVESEEPRSSHSSRRTPPRPSTTTHNATSSPTSPNSPQHPPSIRLISVDVERESQKVRSLYEPGEGLKWEDGARLSSFGERLEPTIEVPSDVDEHASIKSQSQDPGQPHQSPEDRPGTPTPAASGIPESSAPTASPQGEQLQRKYELAGGIEDWEDVEVEDVDRYGFIAPRRPMTPSSAPPPGLGSPGQDSPRKHRNLSMRKDEGHYSKHLGLRRGPSKKMSTRSLHTTTSKMSTASRRSTRSAFRQAANLLPHNRDRRWMDEAGEMLAEQHGFVSIGEDTTAGQLADEYKQKEWQRTEKWRRMAKVIKHGKDGEGMVFEFDPKHPKLVERTWKGIPDRWRAAAWYSFLASSARSSKKSTASEAELFAAFHRLQEQPSSDDVQIDLDVPRTISQHIMFRRRYRGGQRLLFRVLHALSLYFPQTGYVQGMASLAATLLSYYDEERCFVMLVRLWELRGLNRLYSPNFTELMDALRDFEKYWLAEKDVAKSLKELCIDPTAYGTRWYLTVFHLSIPFSSQLRVWDIFMLLGDSPPDPPSQEVTGGKSTAQPYSSKGLEILHATSTAIVLALSEHIVDSEFENAMKALTSFVPVKDDDLLMKVVRAEYKQHHSKMKKA
ncbi:hypothetical protein JX265_004986 [Neoarthrinium moseri]|uniref:Rab-GAP TBC domain-containing protein n=1 Tax=Neoarthrinium moseri TaxID=1658444 RepID=A0A9P9WP18_9PEZI|nr:uncharacterized protein JN550_012679 [Neoarthrinium moseri]KAI1846491.1 hypothetical protein JX266_007388 [Neoarthrinium moseri]KAI1858395.1 hypothetical protein JN550_012679 [Neoarthrinium moseri]KAI1873364.1 hypothetical protein JX265_004986 [Neoarthrinium moseri]